MIKAVTGIVIIACLTASLPGYAWAQSTELEVGDDAPPLKVSKWVSGKPITLAEGRGKNIFVVEFWATWCGPCIRSIPHLTKLADRFEKHNVVMVGVSIDEDETRDRVEPFVKEMGKKMGYRVALDDGLSTKRAYLEAAGAEGIPHAFIVGKDGKIAWHGHPMGGLDQKIAEMVGDAAYAESSKQLMEVRNALQQALEDEEWDKGLSLVEKLVQLEPEESSLLVLKYIVLVLKKDSAAAARWGLELVKKLDDPEDLNGLSWEILTDDKYEGARDLQIALAAAKKANELSAGKSWSILDTYARALFETGSRKEALDLQRKSLELARAGKVEKEQIEGLEEALKRYQEGDPGKELPADETPEVEPGFTSLFDGRDLSRHFIVKGKPESWQAAGGVIKSAPGGDRLISREEYGDFVLRLEWKVSKDGNSGVFIRVPSEDDGAPWVSGFEVQISNAPRDDAHCTGSIYGVEAVKPRPDEEAGVWHSLEIACLGKRITVKCDGQRCIDAHYDRNAEMAKRPLKGRIGLQDSHAGPGSAIEYRNIRIQKLLPDGGVPGFASLTAASSGWRTTKSGHGTGGRWTFGEGVWTGEQDPPGSGNGGINLSAEKYGDFELIVETRPDWGCDSGIFLRSTESGRSYQIMVDYNDGGNVGGIYGEGTGAFNVRNYQLLADRSITGSITGRALPFDPAVWARHWKHDDFNEIRSRIQGNPPTIDVWLNGTHLTHFKDDQKRLEDAGHLGLQVHGGKGWPEGARVRYRNVQVRRLEN